MVYVKFTIEANEKEIWDIAKLLSKKGVREGLLYLDEVGVAHYNAIQRHTKVPKATLHKDLGKLVELGILSSPQHLIFDENVGRYVKQYRFTPYGSRLTSQIKQVGC